MTVDSASVSVSDLELHSDSLDVRRAAAIYNEHGAVVVRGNGMDHLFAALGAIMHGLRSP